MIICSCNVISDHDVREAVASTDVEVRSTAQVYICLGHLVHCGLYRLVCALYLMA